MAFTTRDVRIRLRSELIHISSRDKHVSLQMLLGSAEMRKHEIETFTDTVRCVLTMCCELPMALAVAGSAIRLALMSSSGASSAEVWGESLSELESHPKDLLHDNVDNDGYENLSSKYWASLSTLDKNVLRILHRKPLMSMLEMYRVLMVLQRQGWIPISALERL